MLSCERWRLDPGLNAEQIVQTLVYLAWCLLAESDDGKKLSNVLPGGGFGNGQHTACVIGEKLIQERPVD